MMGARMRERSFHHSDWLPIWAAACKHSVLEIRDWAKESSRCIYTKLLRCEED